MKVRRLDSAGDWTFGGGLRSYAVDSEAIAQNVMTALQSLHSDWFLDVGHGIKWFDHLRKNPDISAMEIELKTAILGVDGVVMLTDFQINLDAQTRRGTVYAEYTDIFNKDQRVTVNAPNN